MGERGKETIGIIKRIIISIPHILLYKQLIEKQHCLSNLQAIVIDTAVSILCKTQLLSEKRNAVPEFRYSRDRLVQCSIGHFLCGGGD